MFLHFQKRSWKSGWSPEEPGVKVGVNGCFSFWIDPALNW